MSRSTVLSFDSFTTLTCKFPLQWVMLICKWTRAHNKVPYSLPLPFFSRFLPPLSPLLFFCLCNSISSSQPPLSVQLPHSAVLLLLSRPLYASASPLIAFPTILFPLISMSLCHCLLCDSSPISPFFSRLFSFLFLSFSKSAFFRFLVAVFWCCHWRTSFCPAPLQALTHNRTRSHTHAHTHNFPSAIHY